jgi:hypothetical protein
MTTFLVFTVDEQASKGKRTKVISVLNRNGGYILGTIKWWAPWRQYTFWPEPCMIFNRNCLNEIADYCKKLTDDHRAKAVSA